MYLHFQQVGCTVAPLTASEFTVPAEATHVELQAQDTADVNYTMDNVSNPGSSSGMILRSTDPPKLFLIEDFKRIRFCSSSGTSSLHAHFIGRPS